MIKIPGACFPGKTKRLRQLRHKRKGLGDPETDKSLLPFAATLPLLCIICCYLLLFAGICRYCRYIAAILPLNCVILLLLVLVIVLTSVSLVSKVPRLVLIVYNDFIDKWN